MSYTYPPSLAKYPGESRIFAVDFAQYREIREGETLTGTPTVTVSPAGPDISGVAISGSQVQFRVVGGTADTKYVLTVTCETSGSNTLSHDVPLAVY